MPQKTFIKEITDLRTMVGSSPDSHCDEYWACIEGCYNSGGRLGCMHACREKYPDCGALYDERVKEIANKYNLQE